MRVLRLLRENLSLNTLSILNSLLCRACFGKVRIKGYSIMRMNRLIWGCLIGLISLSPLKAETPTAPIEIVDINNNTLTGSNITIDEAGTCTLKKKAKEISLACGHIIEIIFNNPLIKTKNPWVITLNNNDLIYGEIIESAQDGFLLKSTTSGKIAIHLEHLLKMRSIADPATAWKEIPEAKEEDVIYFFNGDRDTGVIKGISRDTIKFQSTVYGKDRNYETAAIAGIAFAQITPPPPPPVGLLATIIGTDRSRFTGRIEKVANSSIHSHSHYLGKYQLSLDRVVQIYFKTKQCSYLSDLKPIRVKEYPTIYDPEHIVFPWPYQPDRNVTSGKLISLQGKKFYKGLGVHANCELTYRLDGAYKRFFAVVGLDDEAGPKASVEFLVFLDGQPAYESGLIKWGDDPKQVDLSMAQAKEIRLVVTDGGDMHILDRAAWAKARLIK